MLNLTSILIFQYYRWPMFKFWLTFDCVREYFPVRLIKTAELDPQRNYLMPTFPHGIFPQGIFWNFFTNTNNVIEIFPGIDFRCILMELMLRFPFAREYFLAMGLYVSNNLGHFQFKFISQFLKKWIDFLKTGGKKL